MPTLLLRFPGGRYHATPSGHHVNEGLVEWPPSPWRLVRALIACGYSTLRWHGVPEAGRRLFEALATTLPSYRLPRASLAHSRHYMPKGVLEKGREKTTLVFDTWADVGDAALAVRWSCKIDDEARALFAELARNLGYLGRSESWVLAEAIEDAANPPPSDDAYPHTEGHRGERGFEQVALLAPEVPADYARWREEAVAAALARFPLPEGKKRPSARLLKQRAEVEAVYPVDLLDSLQRDTSWWKGHGWSQPPGARRVLYWRRSDSLAVSAPPERPRREPAPVKAMLLALTTPSGSRSALPSRARALPQAELLHRALVARVCKGSGLCPELTGKGEDGRPLAGHRHAHILPVDLDGDGRTDHVLLYAPMGLGAEAQRAVRQLKHTYTKGSIEKLQVALAGYGALGDLRHLKAPLGARMGALLGPAQVWTSYSPWVPPRYPKPRGPNTLVGQLRTELAARGLPAAEVELLPWDNHTLDLRHAVRVRRHPAKPPPVDAGFAVRLVFERAVAGPITVGYGSHFGLGLFVSAG